MDRLFDPHADLVINDNPFCCERLECLSLTIVRLMEFDDNVVKAKSSWVAVLILTTELDEVRLLSPAREVERRREEPGIVNAIVRSKS